MGEGDDVRLVSGADNSTTWTIGDSLHSEWVDAERFEAELKALAEKGILSYRKDKTGAFLVRSLVGPFTLAVTMQPKGS